jgi:hypothetical protein
MTSKDIIEAHFESVSIKADRARARRWSNDSNGPASRTTEEQLFQVLVTTRIEIKYVLETYDELVQLAKSSSSVDPQDAPISRQMVCIVTTASTHRSQENTDRSRSCVSVGCSWM